MHLDNTAIHLIAGGAGGTVGAVLTCPLEVVKTRLQSSVATFSQPVYVTRVMYQAAHQTPVTTPSYIACTASSTCTQTTSVARPHTTTSTQTYGLYRCLKHIVQKEGPRALFKGLGPNLIGVAPSRAIYFSSYAQSKCFFNSVITPESPLVHICSAACAGFTASTATNPIWFIKTRLQLDQNRYNGLSTIECIRQVYRKHGIVGFYKGITASYYGISETVIHFVIYEGIKAKLREVKGQCIGEEERGAIDFIEFMAAGATSKTIATCIAYPHEVARTRLREEGNKYHGFWQTLATVFKEEGVRGMYRGLVTQLVRQIPNTAIMMSTYEAVVYLCTRYM
ncbi:hypothetical protein LSH36_188g05004 [Paralvinella palmiformis]|uniref:Mitochondrial carrier protein n=1 Tax=Paralvinella palmiformis TaxID=53620 RepID=A0AAD9N838_9ANNE|nr:hypothetical protein LSH36_188g05004 [Paralvinella palmiformis]